MFTGCKSLFSVLFLTCGLQVLPNLQPNSHLNQAHALPFDQIPNDGNYHEMDLINTRPLDIAFPQGHMAAVAAGFSPDGKYAFAQVKTAQGAALAKIDSSTGKVLTSFPITTGQPSSLLTQVLAPLQANFISGLDVAGKGMLTFVEVQHGDFMEKVPNAWVPVLLDAQTGKALKAIDKAHPLLCNQISKMKLSSDGQYLAVEMDMTLDAFDPQHQDIVLYDLSANKRIAHFKGGSLHKPLPPPEYGEPTLSPQSVYGAGGLAWVPGGTLMLQRDAHEFEDQWLLSYETQTKSWSKWGEGVDLDGPQMTTISPSGRHFILRHTQAGVVGGEFPHLFSLPGYQNLGPLNLLNAQGSNVFSLQDGGRKFIWAPGDSHLLMIGTDSQRKIWYALVYDFAQQRISQMHRLPVGGDFGPHAIGLTPGGEMLILADKPGSVNALRILRFKAF